MVNGNSPTRWTRHRSRSGSNTRRVDRSGGVPLTTSGLQLPRSSIIGMGVVGRHSRRRSPAIPRRSGAPARTTSGPAGTAHRSPLGTAFLGVRSPLPNSSFATSTCAPCGAAPMRRSRSGTRRSSRVRLQGGSANGRAPSHWRRFGRIRSPMRSGPSARKGRSSSARRAIGRWFRGHRRRPCTPSGARRAPTSGSAANRDSFRTSTVRTGRSNRSARPPPSSRSGAQAPMSGPPSPTARSTGSGPRAGR